ncbi:MAG: hypothetical protein RI963_2763 [Planctomycetota bacterium]|jgi:hypothetical protein
MTTSGISNNQKNWLSLSPNALACTELLKGVSCDRFPEADESLWWSGFAKTYARASNPAAAAIRLESSNGNHRFGVIR